MSEKKNAAYSLKAPDEMQASDNRLPSGIPSGNQVVDNRDTQYRLGKDSIEIELGYSQNNSDDDVIYARTRENIVTLYQKYFCSNPTEYEIGEIYKSLQHFHEGKNRIPFSFDNDDKELLEIAFEAAAKNNSCNVAYIEGVFKQMWRRGIKNAAEYWEQQFEFDKNKGKV